jgi:hypothetical protein
MEYLAEVIRIAGELGLTSWERLALILALAILLALVKIHGAKILELIKNIKVEPQEPKDENGSQPPGEPLPTGPIDPTGGSG